MKQEKEQLFCSFCGKPKELTQKLIAGPSGIYICDECIEICREVIATDSLKEQKTAVNLTKWLKKIPIEIIIYRQKKQKNTDLSTKFLLSVRKLFGDV